MTTPFINSAGENPPLKITQSEIKPDNEQKSMTRRLKSAIRKTMRRKPPIKNEIGTYSINEQDDFRKRENGGGFSTFTEGKKKGKDAVVWIRILRIDPLKINPEIEYTNYELKEVVTKVLKHGEELKSKFGKGKLSEKKTKERDTALEKWQETEVNNIKEKARDTDSSNPQNIQNVLDNIQVSIDADESNKKLTARLKQLLQTGGRSRRRRRNRLQNKK